MTTVLLAVALAAHVAVIVGWLLRHGEISEARRTALSPGPVSAEGDATPHVTVIIPAKDESANIEECLASVLAQDYPACDVVVIDDRSEDGTLEAAQAAAEAGRATKRVRVIRNDDLPDGWLGKSHACWLGAEQARGEWLLFVDADCRLERGALSAAMREAQARRLDLLSLWPRDGSEGFWERLLVPLCGAMIVLWYGSSAKPDSESRPASFAVRARRVRRANREARPRVFANGQFMLLRREAYLGVDGHRGVRSALIEDIPLAQRLADAGYRVGSALGAEVASVRMYRSLGEVVHGWSRIYIGVLTPGQMVGCLASLAIGSLLPMVLLPISAAVVMNDASSAWGWAWLASSSLHLLALYSGSVRFFSLARCKLRYLWLYPLSVLGVATILLSALLPRFREPSIEWRGTSYRVARNGEPGLQVRR